MEIAISKVFTHAGSASAQGSTDACSAPYVAEWRNIEFCGLPMTIGLTVAQAIDLAFHAEESETPLLTTFINPGSFWLAKNDKSYAANLASFHFVLPDGIGVVWGFSFLNQRHLERISFDSTSLALPLLKRASQENRSVMLIGGHPGVAERARKQLAAAVEGLQIIGAMSGYCPYPEYEGAVRSIRPNIIICGMGAPRQEELLVRLCRARVWKGLGYTCGGYFDQLQEGLRYYPPMVDRLNLRWLYRLVKEPRRLWHRYAIEYQDYGRTLLRQCGHWRARLLTRL